MTQRIGIRENAFGFPGYNMFDPRTTREVEATRDLTNRKPYRTRAQKEEARRTARRDPDGAWRSGAGVSLHPVRRGGK